MLVLRSLARSAPPAIGCVGAWSSATVRPCAAAAASALRPARAAFSVMAGRRADEFSDAELSEKLISEIQIEEELKANEPKPASIKDFLAHGPFELQDMPGHEVVKLVRSFKDERITISFSVSDISNYEHLSEDSALDDEDLPEDPVQNANEKRGVSASGGARSAGAEEQIEEELDEDDMGGDVPPPINLSIVVEKPGKTSGALNIEASANDRNIVVENVFFYDDAKMAKLDSPEAAKQRSEVYPGPPFGSLDEDLQVLMERFLEERGITQAMAAFIPDYVDVKEQAEYLRWLNKVKAFVDA